MIMNRISVLRKKWNLFSNHQKVDSEYSVTVMNRIIFCIKSGFMKITCTLYFAFVWKTSLPNFIAIKNGLYNQKVDF